VAVALIFRLVIGLVHKAGAIELHRLVGLDIGVGKREDNGVSVDSLLVLYLPDGLVRV
jgi:hypothetical protein